MKHIEIKFFERNHMDLEPIVWQSKESSNITKIHKESNMFGHKFLYETVL